MIASNHSHRSRTPQPGGTKREVPGSTASYDAGIPSRSPTTPPPSSLNISTACSGRTPSESPTMIDVGAAMARMSSSGQAKSVADHVRMADRQLQGDAAAHAVADNVGAVDAEV
jgi:hypothetical protein